MLKAGNDLRRVTPTIHRRTSTTDASGPFARLPPRVLLNDGYLDIQVTVIGVACDHAMAEAAGPVRSWVTATGAMGDRAMAYVVGSA